MSGGIAALEGRIRELRKLSPGWNGYGSPVITDAAIDHAIHQAHIGLIPVDAHVAPVGGGGLQLEWSRDGEDVELEFLPDGSWRKLVETKGGPLQNGGGGNT